MSLQYIIDGYNIINHPLFIQHAPKKIKDSKALLLEFIRVNRLCGSPKNKITVVFDGHPDLSSRISDKTEINVIFSKIETADERIKKIVEKTGNPKNAVVVSDDKEIIFFAKSFGAKVLNIQEFINRAKYLIGSQKKEPMKPELSYSQIHKINQELRQLWLKP